ncbi:MAG: acyl carrier protein [Candidatus Omnitrophota bacterium]
MMCDKVEFDQVKKEIKTIISEISEIPEEELKDGAKFIEDLGIDSMMALEMVAAIEKKYRISIPEQEIPNMRSLENIYEILERIFAK